MLKRFVLSTIALATVLAIPVHGRAQTAQPAPAPRRDISGIWTPANGPGDGIQGTGAKNMPEDGKPEHQLPYTPLGLEMLAKTKPGNGARMVHPSEINDPEVISCEPQGMPRQNLYELRTTQILQTPVSVVILYQFDKIWRVIWADGRELEKEHPEPRWFGYSVGKWEDDYTFVVTTNGTDERTWLDKAGRPHSEDLVITERFHRVSRDRLELTMIIDDPKMYTKTWVALDKFPFKLMPPTTDVREMMCSNEEFKAYHKAMEFLDPDAK